MNSEHCPGLQLLCLVSIFLAAGGCGKTPELVPATGKILFEDQPIPGALIKLVPEMETGGFTAHATSDHAGAFTVETYPHGQGASPGSYRVVVKMGTCCGEDHGIVIPSKYSDPLQTPLRVHVTDKGLEPKELRLVP